MKSLRPFVQPLLAVLSFASASDLRAADSAARSSPADRALADYFRAETAKLSERCLADVNSLEDWKSQRQRRRQELFDMLGLWPMPQRTDLKPVLTGQIERADFTVEKLHFQSLPGLYVTANLYLPKTLPKPAPAVLYVCGHAVVKTNGVSYGNKVGYQHHGIWFARHGYVCLLIDTLQLGEIEGLHHGTYREGMWWWNSRGYTPAGVEAWNSIRALDYLGSRPEVDPERLGITGRSGGGSYSWTTAALDERVKVVAPVAGITDLQNHVVDGCVEGHCDCMYFVNTYRWDFPLNAALIAPRPLLIVNTDSDNIFPLDGVERLHAKVKQVYKLYNATTNLGLVIGPGPHKDSQDLQVPVFRWFNKHLKGEDPLIEDAAVKLLTPEQLKVFASLPTDQINTKIQECFGSVVAANRSREETLRLLREKTFRGWPDAPTSLDVQPVFSVKRHGLWLRAFDFTSQAHVRLRLFVAQSASLKKPERVVLEIQDETAWKGWRAAMQTGFGPELAEAPAASAGVAAPGISATHAAHRFDEMVRTLKTGRNALAWLAPRGMGLTAWSGDAKKQTQIRRRFMLLGQTLDGMRVWDICRGLQALHEIQGRSAKPPHIHATGPMAVNVLYAALFEDGIQSLDLSTLPPSHRDAPDYLNVLHVLDIPQAVALVKERVRVASID
jgi:dienelactone hydrolase